MRAWLTDRPRLRPATRLTQPQRTRARSFRAVWAALAALVWAAVAFGIVWAHPSLIRSEPLANTALDQAPAQVSVWFDEAIEPGHGNLSVYDAQGRRVDNIDTRYQGGAEPSLNTSLPDLPQGSYVVVWRVISVGDGHAVAGAFSFGVGVEPDLAAAAAASAAADTQPDLTTHLIAFLGLFAQIAFLGMIAFQSLVWRPAVARHLGDGTSLLREQRRFLQVAADVLVGALVIGLLGALYSQARATGVIFWELFGTRWGLVWLGRVALTLPLALLMEPLLLGRRPAWLGWALGVGLLAATTLTSHSSARPGWIGPLADLAHQFSAAVWFGGLVMLVLSLLILRRSPEAGAARAPLAAECLARFSGLAAASVGLLMVSGLVLSVQQVASWPGLMLTPYGQALLVKVAIAAAALLFGAYNALVWQRWRSGTAERSLADNRRMVWVAAESAVVAVALFVAAVLTELPPATAGAGASTDAESAGLALAVQAADFRLEGVLQPGRVGANMFEVTATDTRTGQPVIGAQAELLFQPVAGGGLASRLALEEAPEAAGAYRGTGSGLTRQGPWQIMVTLSPAGLPPAYATFDLDIGLDDVVRPAGSALPLRVRAVDWLNHHGQALLALAAFSLAAGWTWIARRAVPGLQSVGWIASGLLLAAAAWSVVIALNS